MGRVERIFWPNPTHMGRVRSGWTHGFNKLLLLLLLNWVEKNININILKKNQKISINVTP